MYVQKASQYQYLLHFKVHDLNVVFIIWLLNVLEHFLQTFYKFKNSFIHM